MTAGFFQILCIVTNDGYVGFSQNIESRTELIKNMLRQRRWLRKEKVSQMLVDWEKYGEESFCVAILEKCNSLTKQSDRERYWKAKVNSVYNIPTLDVTPIKEDSGIYLITNIETGENYVGATQYLRCRHRTHLYNIARGKANCNILHSFNQSNLHCLKFEVLEYCEPTLLNDREKYWFDIIKPSMNISKKFWSRHNNFLSAPIAPTAPPLPLPVSGTTSESLLEKIAD